MLSNIIFFFHMSYFSFFLSSCWIAPRPPKSNPSHTYPPDFRSHSHHFQSTHKCNCAKHTHLHFVLNSVALIQREARRRKMLSKPRQSSWAAGMTEAAAEDRRDRQAAAADDENTFFYGSNDSCRPPRSSGEFNM